MVRGPIGASSRTRPLVTAGSTARRPATPTGAVREPKTREAQHPNSNRTRHGPNERPSRGTPSAPGTPPSARGRCTKSMLRLVACKFLTAAPSARLEPQASASVARPRPCLTACTPRRAVGAWARTQEVSCCCWLPRRSFMERTARARPRGCAGQRTKQLQPLGRRNRRENRQWPPARRRGPQREGQQRRRRRRSASWTRCVCH